MSSIEDKIRRGESFIVASDGQYLGKLCLNRFDEESIANQRPDLTKQIAATRQQLVKAEMEQQRFENLVKNNAANQKQLDDAVSAVDVLKRQLEAQISALSNTTQSLNSQMNATDIQRLQVGF